jgi:RNA polymerase sigma-70 factor (ECF subfamily)
MMRHLYLDKIRHKTLDISQQLENANEPQENDTPDSKVEMEDEAFLVKDLIAHLPPRERDIMKMYLLEELSYEEMEISTGIRQGNLRQIVTRTRKKLKEQFIKIARTWKG